MKNSIVFAILLIAFQVSSVKSQDNVFWCFWFVSTEQKVFDQKFSSKESCEKAEKGWKKDKVNPRVVFSCKEVTQTLLKEAENKCKNNESLTCSWAGNIKTLLNDR